MSESDKQLLLSRIFRFTEEDILANQKNILSERQREWLDIVHDSFIRNNRNELFFVVYGFLAGWFVYSLWRGFRHTEHPILLYCILSYPSAQAVLILLFMSRCIYRKERARRHNRKGRLNSVDVWLENIGVDHGSRTIFLHPEVKLRLAEHRLRLLEHFKLHNQREFLRFYYWAIPGEEFVHILSVSILD
jgi:hypothetical protein